MTQDHGRPSQITFRNSKFGRSMSCRRLGTVLEGVEQIIFQHSSEGLIRHAQRLDAGAMGHVYNEAFPAAS